MSVDRGPARRAVSALTVATGVVEAGGSLDVEAFMTALRDDDGAWVEPEVLLTTFASLAALAAVSVVGWAEALDVPTPDLLGRLAAPFVE